MTNNTINEQSRKYWTGIYRKGAIYAPEHGVLVANLGEWAGFWSADGFIEVLGSRFVMPESNRSQINTLTDALYARGINRPTSDEDLLALVDGIVDEIFPDGVDVEWSTLRKLMSVDGVVKRAIANDDGFDVVEFARDTLAVLRDFRLDGRDYFGNSTTEMVAAIAEADYSYRLSPKGVEKSDADYGDKADRVADQIEKDPDAGLEKAFVRLERVLNGEGKDPHRMAWFDQRLEAFIANAEAWRIAYDATAELVETTV
jgi:hypothetical protein